MCYCVCFVNATAATGSYPYGHTLSLLDVLPIERWRRRSWPGGGCRNPCQRIRDGGPGALVRRRRAEWKSREMTMPGNDKAGGAGSDDLTIRDVRARLVEVPMRFALGTSADVVRVAPLLQIGRAHV